MKLTKCTIAKTDLLKIPKREMLWLIQFMNFLSDIAIIRKATFFSAKEISDGIVVRESQDHQVLIYITLQAGKLLEGWKYIKNDFFGCKSSKTYIDQLDSEEKNCLSFLKNYFHKTNNIFKIRNRFAFHYSKESSDAILNQIAKADDSEQFDVYFSEDHYNCFYQLSYILRRNSIFDLFNPNDREQAIQVLVDETEKVTKHFLDFIGGVIMKILSNYNFRNFAEVEIPDPPRLKDIKLPYFTLSE